MVEKCTCQGTSSGTMEQALLRLVPCGHRGGNWLSAQLLQEVLDKPGPPQYPNTPFPPRQELLPLVPRDVPDDIHPRRSGAPG